MKITQLKEYVSFSEAAKMIGSKRTNIYYHIIRCKLSIYEIKPHKVLLRSEVEKLVRKRKSEKLLKLIQGSEGFLNE